MSPAQRTRREALQWLGWGTAGLALSGCTGIPKGGRERRRLPNFVIILTDDQGYGDLGCYGRTDFDTPRLDRMAAEGVRFTDFHVSQAVCSASRASLLTGCYSERVGILGALGPGDRIGLGPDELTIAQMLKKKGYATAVFGKWHLGHRPEFLPLRRGFDEYCGLPYSNDMWPMGYDGRPLPDGRKSSYPPLPLIEDDRAVRTIGSLDEMSVLTGLYTDRAIRFIEKNMDRPFFLYLPHSMPHTPLAPSAAFRGRSRHGPYGDVIEEIDASAGRILDTIRKHGLDEDTLAVFASDNGPWLNFGASAGSSGPLREGKGTVWEGGDRVPCLMRWPGRIPAGRVCGKIASTIDLLPTIAEYTGAALPGHTIDGVSLAALLAGDDTVTPRDHFFYYYGRELQAVRRNRWKLVFPHTYRSYKGVAPGQNGMPGSTREGRSGLELYDLEADIGETTDVAAAHRDIVKSLQALAEKARADLGDSLTGRVGRGVRPPGRV